MLRISALPERTPSVAAAPGRLEMAFFYISMIVLEGTFLTTPRLLMSGGSLGDETTGSDPVNQLSFGFLLVGTAVLLVRHFGTTLYATKRNAFYFLLPALMIFSTAWSLFPALTLKRSIWTTGVCFFDLYIVMRLSLDEIFKIISRTVLVGLVASVVVSLGLPDVGREMGSGLNGEWRGVFAQKNQLGHVMSTGAVVQLLIMLRAGRMRAGPILLFLACTVLIKLSQSATSLMALMVAVGIAITYICVRRGGASTITGGLIFAAGLCVLAGLSGAEDGSGLSFLGRDSTLTGRTDLWPPVIQMINMHPWHGWGFEAFWTVDNPYFVYVRDQARWPAPNAHNGLLEIALDLGLLGIVGFALVMGWAVKRAIQLLVGGDMLGIIVLIVLVQLIIGNITESFVLESTIFGWNFLTMLIFSMGLKLPGKAPFHGVPAQAILDRAKPRNNSAEAIGNSGPLKEF
ncbi:MAG TPA: O-antigen ligase family protein [Aliidongia sp.]|nr:O-antigen ligase family protein [Aliidongia sp.]